MKLSVFVVTYNQEKYIRQCLDSILMQEVDFDYEVVIGEDHGTDGTRSICEEYAEKYPQVRLLPLTENLGVAGNWRRVLSECRGEYVAMCEGDDFWLDPKRLQKQVDFLDSDIENKYVMCFHKVVTCDENGNIMGEYVIPTTKHADKTSEELRRGIHPPTQSVAFRRKYLSANILESLKKYNSNSNDTVLFSLLGKFGDAKYQADIKESVYRVHANSVWNGSSILEKEICGYETCNFLQNQQKDLQNEFRQVQLSKACKIVEDSIRQKKYKVFLVFYPKTIKLAIQCKDYCRIYVIHKSIIYNFFVHKFNK